MFSAVFKLAVGVLILLASGVDSTIASSNTEMMAFSVHRSCNADGKCTDVMMAEGYIDSNADERFRSFILPFATVTMVCFDSQGGDVGSAIRMAADIRTLGLSTCSFERYNWPRKRVEPARCHSACSFVFFGGVYRVSGGRDTTPIGIHQLQFSASVNHERMAGIIYGRLGMFIEQLGIKSGILRLAAAVPFSDIYPLSIDEAIRYGVVTDIAATPKGTP